nr:MAG TPA: hypothetical protein [Caudoviricetes sp.]
MFSRIHFFTYVISCSVMCILSLSDSDKTVASGFEPEEAF